MEETKDGEAYVEKKTDELHSELTPVDVKDALLVYEVYEVTAM